MPQSSGTSLSSSPAPSEPSATRIFLRGLAITLPPILTLFILFAILHGINDFIVQPISWAVRSCIAQAVVQQQTRTSAELVKPDGLPSLPFRERQYLVSNDQRRILLEQLGHATAETRERETILVREQLKRVAYVQFDSLAVPYTDYAEVYDRLGPLKMPKTASGVYMELATTRNFQPWFHFTAIAIVISVALVYSVGRIVTHRLGAWFVLRVGSFVTGVPLVGAIYTSVKHITDFFLAEKDPKYRRVVAIEYPRPGIWTLAFVTGDGMSECVQVAGEPLVNVLIPSAPVPFAGYTMNVKQSELLDLDMSLDQAIQYIMSCGVIVPQPVSGSTTNVKNGVSEPPPMPGQAARPAF